MARHYGKAGRGAWDMALKREALRAAWGFALLLLLWLWIRNMSTIAILGIPAFVVVFMIYRVVLGLLDKQGAHLRKRARQAERGAVGEETVAKALQEVPQEFVVFHDLLFEGFNIDHVSVGKAGIFLVETKSQGGIVTNDGLTLLLNGQPTEKDFINQCWHQSYRLKEYLKERTGKAYEVRPVLTFSSAAVQTRGLVKGVMVLGAKSLSGYLINQPKQLEQEQVDAIVTCLRDKVKR